MNKQVILLNGETKSNKDGFFLNNNTENLGLSSSGKCFGQIPVAFRQRLLLCFLGDVLHSGELADEGL